MLFKFITLSLMFISTFSQTVNPFLNKQFYVNPTFQRDIDSSLSTSTDPIEIQNLKIARNSPSAYWLDVRSKVQPDDTSLSSMNGILLDATKTNPSKMVVFIVYDLPNRDCNAKASNGELCCTYKSDGRCDYSIQGDCSQGLKQYKTEYIDNIVKILKKYDNKVQIGLVIEPDSLPNLVTNLGNPSCGNSATQTSYKEGITYAVTQIKTNAPNTALYLDSGHGGWLGWENNMKPFQQLVQSLGILPYLRGFSTNVANYQPLGKMCPQKDFCLPISGNQNNDCCSDPCKLTSQWNPANNEMNYVLQMSSYFSGKYFIIDTGRNGVSNMRTDCANWCNIRNTGMGQYPTTDTGSNLVDALFWLKTPGESDGCTEFLPDKNRCPRFDYMCNSVDSIGSINTEPRVPEAGKWFDYHVKMLARNANFGKIPVLPPTPTPTPTPTPIPGCGKWKCKECVFVK